MFDSWKSISFLAKTIDPLHVGNGGQRLGRVDLTVIREPITNVPKIPGTTLSGALKSYCDLALRSRGKSNICAAVAGSDDDKNKHDRSECPVCSAFGFTTEKKSMQGILNFSDALLLAYPVNTLVGPVWITTAERLQSLCSLGSGSDDINEGYLPVAADSETFTKNKLQHQLNFGWILLDQAKNAKAGFSVEDLVKKGVPAPCAERMVIVSELVFQNLVNSNMEVRTSVVINPETGAAQTGGLFTYEAVARGALFVFTITENDYAKIWDGVKMDEKPASALDMIQKFAFPGVAAAGLGGMTSRGFGRITFSAMED